MAKVQGLQGGISGKLGNTVFRQRRGETVAAQYQPVVSNPRTEAQVSQRERFKLMSSLSALFKQAIFYKTNGSLSARNLFVSKNFANFYVHNNGEAQLNAANIQLTDGSNEIQGLNVTSTNLETNPSFTIEAKGGFVVVATRPERRRLRVVILAVPQDPTMYDKLQISPVFEILPNQTPTETTDISVYEDTITNVGTFQGLGSGWYYVVYAYEVNERSSVASTRYSGLQGNSGAGDTPLIFVSSESHHTLDSYLVSASMSHVIDAA